MRMNRTKNISEAVGTLLGLAGFATALTFSPTVAPMDFAFRQVSLAGQGAGNRLVLQGEIRQGDALRLREFLVAHSAEYLGSGQVVLDSPGGDIAEAVRVAQVLREVLAIALVSPPAHC